MLALSWGINLLIRQLTGSRLVHVAIGYGDVVLSVSYAKGNQYFPLLGFAIAYPRLCLVVEVPLCRAIDLDRYSVMEKKRIIPTFLRWLTGGRIKTGDCVCTTVDLLRSGGVPVPVRTTSPAQLWHWLRLQGYKYAQLDEHLASDLA